MLIYKVTKFDRKGEKSCELEWSRNFWKGKKYVLVPRALADSNTTR